MQPQPQMRSFEQVTRTPASATGTRNAKSTSSRATRGKLSSQRSSDGSQNRPSKSSSNEIQEPRKPILSPEPKRQSDKETPPKEVQMLQLPPSLFPHWCLLLLCSALCLAAAAAGTPLTTNSSTAENSSETIHYENLQMVMAIATLSLMLTFLASACYVLIPASFVGTLYEVTVIGLNIVLQGGNLPIVMNPANDLAVQGPSIVNGNLFVMSWISFLFSWVILKLVLEQAYCMDQARNGNLVYLTATRDGYPPLVPITPYRMAFLGLVLSSLVVLVSSTRSYRQQLCSDWDRQLCARLQFSISVAVMSLLGVLITWGVYIYHIRCRKNESPTSSIPSTRVQLGLIGLLTFGWFLATAMGTFGKHGPGHALGNYFFGVWMSLILSMYLLKKTMLEHFARQSLSKQRVSNQQQHQQQHQSKRRSHKQSRIPGLIQDDDMDQVSREHEEPPLSMSTTDDMECGSAVSPSIVTPHVCKEKPKSKRSKERKPRDPIAISLEESFRNEEDPEQGLRIIQRASTDKTAEEDFEDDHVDTEKTPKRGSATRSASRLSATGQSGASSASQRIERIKPTTIPFVIDDSNVRYDIDEEKEDDYDYNGLSTSAITTAIDNRSKAHDADCLIDPKDFSQNML